MLLSQREYGDGVRLGIWRLEENSQDLLRQLNDSAVEAEFAGLSESHRCEKLAARLLLNELLGRKVHVEYEPSGKPLLADRSAHISLSHTRGYVAVIVHPTKQVGVDIEYISERADKLKSRFLSSNERRNVAGSIQTLLYWCAKETLFKVIDESGIDFATQLHIAPFVCREQGTMNASETRTANRQHYFLHYERTANYVLVWTSV